MKKQPITPPILIQPDTPANLTLEQLVLLTKKIILGAANLPDQALRCLPLRWQTVFKAVQSNFTRPTRQIAFWNAINHWEDAQQVTDAINQVDIDQPHDHIIDQLLELPAILPADRLRSARFPRPAWVIPDLLPVGLAILWGPPKSGKTSLALQFSRAAAAGEPIFEKPVQPHPVLYLALDEPPSALQERLRLQDWPEGMDVDFLPLGNFHHAIGGFFAEGINNLTRHIKCHPYRFIIIDTLTRALLGGQPTPRLLSPVLAPLQEVAHTANAAILLIDHFRASVHLRPDPFRDLTNPLARFQVVDTGLGLYPFSRGSEAHLRVIGRRVPEHALHLRFREGLWEYIGEVPQHQPDFLTLRERQILDLITGQGRLCGKDIADLLGLDYSNTSRRLRRLASLGILARSTEGGRVYYYLP